MWLAAGSAWKYEINDLVFTDPIGKTIPHSSVEHEFKELVTVACCPEHRFHDLRHTFATLALQHHADVKRFPRLWVIGRSRSHWMFMDT